MEVRLKPDLVISGNTEIDDLIELLEDNKTEFYSLGTLVKFFADSGFEPVIPILLGGVFDNEMFEVEEVVND